MYFHMLLMLLLMIINFHDLVSSLLLSNLQGLLQIFKEKLPYAHNRYCVKHIYQNVSVKFKFGNNVKDNLQKAAYASIAKEFNHWMDNIKKLNESVCNYLHKLQPRCWSRSHFNINVKCDSLVNNMNESWNSCILEAREMFILQIMEWVRMKVMSSGTVYSEKEHI